MKALTTPPTTRKTAVFITGSNMMSPEFLQKLRWPDLDDVSQYIRSVSTPMLFSMGAVAAATTYYLATRPKAIPTACDLNMQSVEIPVSRWSQSRITVKTCNFSFRGQMPAFFFFSNQSFYFVFIYVQYVVFLFVHVLISL